MNLTTIFRHLAPPQRTVVPASDLQDAAESINARLSSIGLFGSQLDHPAIVAYVAHGFAERVFRRRDGLVHDECNTNSQQIDSLDRYWVGTLGGLSVFDPRIDVPSRAGRPKPLFLTELRVDGGLSAV